jgi:hypothetical protein
MFRQVQSRPMGIDSRQSIGIVSMYGYAEASPANEGQKSFRR